MADRAAASLTGRLKRAVAALRGRSYDVAAPKPSNKKLFSRSNRRTAEQIMAAQGQRITDVGRYLYQNAPAAKRTVRHIAQRVVGKTGIVPQFADDDLDAAWQAWAKRCGVRGHSWRALQIAAVSDFITVGNAYTLRAVVDGQLVLDQFEHESLSSLATFAVGNSISGGIEFDKLGRPVNYHVQRTTPGTFGTSVFETQAFPASRVSHIWRLERPEQFRGFSDLATGGLSLFDGDDAIFGELSALRQQAWMGMHLKPGETATGDPATDIAAEDIPAGEQSDGPGAPQKEIDFGVGELFEFDGEATLLSSDRPGGQFLPFMTKLEERWAVSVGIPPHVVNGDYSRANYSSLRAAENTCRPTFEETQQIVIEMHCGPNVRAFVEHCFVSGIVQAKGRTVDSVMAGVEWQVPSFPYVDPLKEIDADIRRVSLGVLTFDQICAERGIDGRKQRQLIKRSQDLDKQFGVQTPCVGKSLPEAIAESFGAPAGSEGGAPQETASIEEVGT